MNIYEYKLCNLKHKKNINIPPPQVEMDINVLSDDLILPFGIERYSTDGEHLPLPPGRRKELDQHFYGDLWEPDAYARGFERDPIAILPLQPRMLANVHKHRSDIKYTEKNILFECCTTNSSKKGKYDIQYIIMYNYVEFCKGNTICADIICVCVSQTTSWECGLERGSCSRHEQGWFWS